MSEQTPRDWLVPIGPVIPGTVEEPIPDQEPSAIDWRDKWPEEVRGIDWTMKAPVSGINPLQDSQMKHLKSDILANVKFVKKLGGGGSGQVFEVTAYLKVKDRNRILWEPTWKKLRLACKIIRHQGMHNKFIEFSLTEMRSLRYLRHINICNFVEIIGIPDKTGFPYSVVCLLFELCDGTFEQFLRVNRPSYRTIPQSVWVLSEKLSRHWFAQIASAVEYIHSNGITHRDIIQKNILYRFEPNSGHEIQFEDKFLSLIFKLADFGEARDRETTPEVYQWTDLKHQMSEKRDIDQLCNILYTTGVPGPRGPGMRTKFFDFCRTGQMLDSYSEEWLNISPTMRDMLARLQDSENKITSRNILSHDWLQDNDEPRTDQYILKLPNFNVNNTYQFWEDPGNRDPNYSPFGVFSNNRREFDQETQQWNYIEGPVLPIQGAPNLHELIDSFAHN